MSTTDDKYDQAQWEKKGTGWYAYFEVERERSREKGQPTEKKSSLGEGADRNLGTGGDEVALGILLLDGFLE